MSSRLLIATMLLWVVACGHNSSQTLPTVPPPPGTSGTTPISTDPSTDPNIPAALQAYLKKAVSFELPTTVVGGQTVLNYTPLNDIAAPQIFVAPLVQTFFALQVPNSRDQNIEGSIMVGFEDQEGFWGAILNTFPGVSQHTTSEVDMIFSDSELSLRFTAGINNDALVNPQIFYRVRQSGETQCEQISYTCVQTSSGSGFWIPSSGSGAYGNGYCTTPPPPQDTAGCQSYMNIGNSQVKLLGTFSSSTPLTYSQWEQ